MGSGMRRLCGALYSILLLLVWQVSDGSTVPGREVADDYSNSDVKAAVLNADNFCVEPGHKWEFGGPISVRSGEFVLVNFPVYFRAADPVTGSVCGLRVPEYYKGRLLPRKGYCGQGPACNYLCPVCGEQWWSNPLGGGTLHSTFQFNMSDIFNRVTLESLPGPGIDAYPQADCPTCGVRHEVGGLSCRFSFDANQAFKLASAECSSRSTRVSFHDTWRWLIQVWGPTWTGDAPYVSLGPYRDIKFLAGSVSFYTSPLVFLSPQTMVAGDLLMWNISLYDEFRNPVRYDTTGITPTQTTWLPWPYHFTGSSFLGANSMNSKTIKTWDGLPSDGFMVFVVPTGLAGSYSLTLGIKFSTQGFYAPFNFTVVPGPFSIASSPCALPPGPYIAGTKITALVSLHDAYTNSIQASNQIIDEFYAGTKLLDFNLYQVVPQVTIAIGSDGASLVISFTSFEAKTFRLRVGSTLEQSPGSPMSITVLPGPVSAADSISFVSRSVFTSSAANYIYLFITPRDAFKNLISIPLDSLWFCYFVVKGGLMRQVPPFTFYANGPTGSGQALSIVVPVVANTYQLFATYLRDVVGGSPFTITVLPGTVSLVRSVGNINATGSYIPGDPVVINVKLKDDFGNVVSAANNVRNVCFSWMLTITRADGSFPYKPLLTILKEDNDGSQRLQILAPKTSNTYFLLHIGIMDEQFSFSPLQLATNQSPTFYIPACQGQWSKNTVVAGTIAMFYVTLLDRFRNKLMVNSDMIEEVGKMVTVSSYPMDIPVAPVPGLYVHAYEVTPLMWQYGRVYVEFVPSVAGRYQLYVRQGNQSLAGSPFLFFVSAGAVSVTASKGFWLNAVNTFTPLQEAILLVQAVDSFGNNVSLMNGVEVQGLRFLAVVSEQQATNVTVHLAGDGSGLQIVSFRPALPRQDYHLQVGNGTSYIQGSPFLFSVTVGPLSVRNCTGFFVQRNRTFAVGALVTFVVSQFDAFGSNILLLSSSPDYHKFTASVYKIVGQTQVLVPVKDMQIQPDTSVSILTSNQTVTFTIYEAGNLELVVSDVDNTFIQDSPFAFNCLAGPWNLTMTLTQGPGLMDTVAGLPASFFIQFRDSYGNPTAGPSAALLLTVKIFLVSGNTETELNDVAVSQTPVGAGFYNVSYKATVAGSYKIQIKASDRNTGKAVVIGPQILFNKTVLPGPIHTEACVASGSGLQGGLAGKANEFKVNLHDYFNNAFPTGVLSIGFTPSGTNTSASVSYEAGSATVRYTVYKIPDTGSIILVSVTVGANQSTADNSLGVEQSGIPGSPFTIRILAGPLSVQACTGIWLNSENLFAAGTEARLRVTQRDQYGNVVSATSGYYNFAYKVFNATSNALVDGSNITLTPHDSVEQGAQLITITFTEPSKYYIKVGSSDNSFVEILGSPFSFVYVPGALSAQTCTGDWVDSTHTLEAGSPVQLLVTPKDAWGNTVMGVSASVFTVSIASVQRPHRSVSVSDLRVEPYDNSTLGQIIVSFSLQAIGAYLLFVGNSTTEIQGSPFPFTLTAGNVSLKTTFATGEGLSRLASTNQWNDLSIHLLDLEGNGVNGKEELLKLAVTGSGTVVVRNFSGLGYGLYGASYTTDKVGAYTVSMKYLDTDISGSPFRVSVVSPGGLRASYCSASISPTSREIEAGQVANVTISVYDANHGVVQSEKNLQFAVEVLPRPSGMDDSVPAYFDKSAGTYVAHLNITDMGDYNLLITLFGTNISGGPYILTVVAGSWSVESSVGTGLALRDHTAGAGDDIFVDLCDQFGNRFTNTTGVSCPSSFTVGIISSNGPPSTISLLPVGNGSYFGTVDWNLAGSYLITIYSGEKMIKNSPFTINVSAGPVHVPSCVGFGSGLGLAVRDAVQYIWVQVKDAFGNNPPSQIDEQGNSVAFSFILQNNAQQANQFLQLSSGLYIANYTIPEVGQYQLSVKANNVHIASSPFLVNVTSDYLGGPKSQPVQCTASYNTLTADIVLSFPYVLSTPVALYALEGRPIPLQGGIPCMEVGFNSPSTTLAVKLTALHGVLYFAPRLRNLWQSVVVLSETDQDFTVGGASTEQQSTKSLQFSGSIPVLNAALQAIQYAGSSYYNGEDNITLQVFNPGAGGAAEVGDTRSVKLYITAVNDPPYILAEATIKTTWWFGDVKGISVGDPDQFDSHADIQVLRLHTCLSIDKGQLLLTLVSTAYIDASVYNKGRWTSVSRAWDGHTMNVRGQGICFTASIDEANIALSSLLWYPGAGNEKGNLTLDVNDLGSFGCYGDCTTAASVPLRSNAVVELLKGKVPTIRDVLRLALGTGIGLMAFLTTIVLTLFFFRRHIKWWGAMEIFINRRFEELLGIDSTTAWEPTDSQNYQASWILPADKEPTVKYAFGTFTGDEEPLQVSERALDKFWSTGDGEPLFHEPLAEAFATTALVGSSTPAGEALSQKTSIPTLETPTGEALSEKTSVPTLGTPAGDALGLTALDPTFGKDVKERKQEGVGILPSEQVPLGSTQRPGGQPRNVSAVIQDLNLLLRRMLEKELSST